jgi:general secretion pathway protein G
MRTRLRKRTRDERGFSLIELLVVIVVLGVLAGIVVFALGGTSSSSRSGFSRGRWSLLWVA